MKVVFKLSCTHFLSVYPIAWLWRGGTSCFCNGSFSCDEQYIPFFFFLTKTTVNNPNPWQKQWLSFPKSQI